MAWVLHTIRKWPQGGFPFREEGPKPMHFPGHYDFATQVDLIYEYRKSNDLPRAKREEVAIDLHAYTCARLGHNPKVCKQVGQITATAMPRKVTKQSGCGTCGARVVNHSG